MCLKVTLANFSRAEPRRQASPKTSSGMDLMGVGVGAALGAWAA
jgi:hypothetical protein